MCTCIQQPSEPRLIRQPVTDIQISPEMTMEQILQVAPAAQRALFQRYHVGGCSACGFEPGDTLAQGAADHNILDVNEVIQTILQAEELDGKIQVEPTVVKQWLDEGQDFSFLDCRAPEERELATVAEAELLDFENSEKYMGLPKEHKIVFLCRDGERSLQVASYFIGHQFTSVFALRGGMLAWSDEVDSSVPKYELT